MRRKDKEISDIGEICKIIERCDTCRIALFDEEYPYIVPLNFGFSLYDNQIKLYFHGAASGKKVDLIKKNPKAGFEMDCSHQVITGEKACDYTMDYESVCGNGILKILDISDKKKALNHIMHQYSGHREHEFDSKILERTMAVELTINEIYAKRSSQGGRV